MRIGLALVLAASLSGPALQLPATAADDQPAFTNEKDKVSYAIGMYFGRTLKGGHFETNEINWDDVFDGIKTEFSGGKTKLTIAEAQTTLMAYQRAKREAAAKKASKEGADFLAANKNKEGVKTQTVSLPGGKTAEFQYKILKEGTGEMPQSNDLVQVNYRGTLVNGTEFDSSAKHQKGPSTFALNQVIPGWSDALKMMKVGAKWEIYIPPDLAYGERGTPLIPPQSTLIFDVELVGVEPPKPPAAPPQQHPITSDIIRVPSAAELKKGAKITVIKPEDAAKEAAAEAAKTNKSEK